MNGKIILDTTKKILINPSVGFKEAIKNRLLLPAVFFIIIKGLLMSLGANLVDFGKYSDHIQVYVFRSPIYLPILIIVLWLGVCLCLFLGGRRLNGAATFADILIVTGFSSLPLIFIDILVLFFWVLGIQSGIINITSGFIFPLWFLILFIIGIKEAHRFSSAKAIGSIIIVILYLLGIGILISLIPMFFRTYF